MEWTKAQAAAINVPRRDVLVAAAAGSGKTATLTERVLRTITREKGSVRREDKKTAFTSPLRIRQHDTLLLRQGRA